MWKCGLPQQVHPRRLVLLRRAAGRQLRRSRLDVPVASAAAAAATTAGEFAAGERAGVVWEQQLEVLPATSAEEAKVASRVGGGMLSAAQKKARKDLNDALEILPNVTRE